MGLLQVTLLKLESPKQWDFFRNWMQLQNENLNLMDNCGAQELMYIRIIFVPTYSSFSGCLLGNIVNYLMSPTNPRQIFHSSLIKDILCQETPVTILS